MLSGVGQLCIITENITSIGQGIFFPGLFYNFVYAGAAQTKKAKAWIGGKRRNVASAGGDEDYTLTLSFQYLDWFHLGFAYDELSQLSEDVSLLIPKTGLVSTESPYKIADNEITESNASSIKVYVPQRGAWGEASYRKVVTNAPTAGQFKVNTQTKEIVFSQYDAGATVQYLITKTYASIETIGYESSAASFGKLSFIGVGYGPEFPDGVYLRLPSITRSSIPSMDTSQDVPEFSITFDANVPPGGRSTHQYFNLATGVLLNAENNLATP